MKNKSLNGVFGLVAVTALAVGTVSVWAETAPKPANLVVNDETEMVTEVAPAEGISHLEKAYDGWRFRASETQAVQSDDFENPGMIFVEQALDNWNKVEGTEGKSCASCHGAPEESMVGVRASYPKWDETMGKVATIEMEINNCRTTRMGAEPWKYTGGKMTAMNALISTESRGMPVNVAIDGPAQSAWEHGKEMYYTRTGQLELSCASCHEQHYGDKIRAETLSQGQINGFPSYRLKNGKLNSIHARFKGCVRDTRAQTYKPGSQDFVDLELYVASRGNGLSVTGPSVRN